MCLFVNEFGKIMMLPKYLVMSNYLLNKLVDDRNCVVVNLYKKGVTKQLMRAALIESISQHTTCLHKLIKSFQSLPCVKNYHSHDAFSFNIYFT